MTEEQKKRTAQDIAEKAKFHSSVHYLAENAPPYYNLCGAVVAQQYADLVNIYYAQTPTGQCKGVDLSAKASLIHFFHSSSYRYYANWCGITLTGRDMIIKAKKEAKKLEQATLKKIEKTIRKEEEREAKSREETDES